MSFTAAGLSCLHHAELELHGKAGDTLACAFMLSGATLTGISRVAADRHYLTDVITGAAVGTFSGAVVPWLMYYQFDLAPTKTSTVVPTASPTEIGAMWTGIF
jgi:membrane-associated phospholipid phosphatase